MIQKVLFSFLFLVIAGANAQSDLYTLKQCIEYAWMNNLDVRQSILSNESAQIDYKQSKTSLLPSFSAGGGQNYQFGRTIDRFTNQFSNQTVRSNNFSLNGNLTIFNGFQSQNIIKQQNALQKSSIENIESTKNQIALSVSNAFLLTIQAEETIHNAEFQIVSTTQSIQRAQRMVDAGTTDLSALLSLKAQLANEELNLITAKNSKNSALLNLKTLMQMPPDKDLNISIPDVDSEIFSNPFNVVELYQIALQNMPQIKAAVLQSEASNFQTRMSKGNLSPSISMYGSLSTVYSQSAKTISDLKPSGTQIIGYIQSTQENVLQPVFDYSLTTISFNKQLKDNLGQGAGINLSWNLFSGFQVQNQIQKAKINQEITELNLLKAKNTLLNEINAAVNNYNAAKAKFDASRNNVEAQKLSLDYIQKRFEAGVSTSFDFIQAKNSYLQAQSSEVQARYELVFRGLILEYYKGNPIKL